MVILFSHLNLAVIAQLSAVSCFLTAHLIALQASNSLESPNFDAGDDPLLDGSEWCFFFIRGAGLFKSAVDFRFRRKRRPC